MLRIFLSGLSKRRIQPERYATLGLKFFEKCKKTLDKIEKYTYYV